METPFPDYDFFSEMAKNYNGPPIDLKLFSQKIANIGMLGKEEGKPILEGIAAMMIRHAVENKKPVSASNPLYGGMPCFGGNGIMFNFAIIDPHLQVTIYMYLETVSNSIKSK